MKKFLFFWLTLLPLAIVSCGSDGKDSKDEPQTTANDPEGTIAMNIVNNDDDNCIDEEWPYMYVGMTPQNNIDTWYHSAEIVSVGKVKGLADIKNIPSSGWAERCAATPGCGYVIRQAKADPSDARKTKGYKYCRVYLVDYITGASGNITGATIKYQLWNP